MPKEPQPKARYVTLVSRGKIYSFNNGYFVDIDLLIPIAITEAILAADFMNEVFDRRNVSCVVDLNHPANKDE